MSIYDITVIACGIIFVMLCGIALYKAEFTRFINAIPFWAANGLRKFAISKKINRFGPLIVGALAFIYQTCCMDGQDYHAQQAWVLYPLIGLFTTTAASAFAATVINPKNSAEIHLSSFIRKLSEVVNAKASRLQEILPNAINSDLSEDRFIDPKEQIDTIFRSGSEFFKENYGLTDEQIDITIITKDPYEDKWSYTYKRNINWTHTPADKLMKKRNCLAKRCLDSGQSVFHPCKELAADNGEYYPGNRDKKPEGKEGSVYCIPLQVGDDAFQWSHVITIITYGKRLCHPNDKQQKAATRFFLLELCKRIQIELINRIIKSV